MRTLVIHVQVPEDSELPFEAVEHNIDAELSGVEDLRFLMFEQDLDAIVY